MTDPDYSARMALDPPDAGDAAPGLLSRLLRRSAPRPPARTPPGMRIYAIGDVHGRLDLLDALLWQVRRDAAIDPAPDTQVVLLGDLIDRGPDSAGVVRRAMAGLGWATLTVLSGNHEQAMTQGLDGDDAMLVLWLKQGGDAALESWGADRGAIGNVNLDVVAAAADAVIPPAERRWIARLPTAIGFGDYHFVHAGIRPGVPIARQTRQDALWIRREFLDSRRDHGVVVVHGHTVSERVVHRHNRIGIDTGAKTTGRLTALALQGEDRWLLQT